MEQAEHHFHIINVAGLMMREGRSDGLEASFHTHLKPQSVVTIAPTPPLRAIREDPAIGFERAGKEIDALLENRRDAPVIGVGRSYGGFSLLQAATACRNRFERFLKLFLIEAPLHPKVEVTPPADSPILRLGLSLCSNHYRERPRLGREMMDRIEAYGGGNGRIVTIGGRGADNVVPLEAMRLPGSYQTIRLEEGDVHAQFHGTDPKQDIHIVLPPSLESRDGLMKGQFKATDRNHLFWSDEKFRIVNEIISALSRV